MERVTKTWILVFCAVWSLASAIALEVDFSHSSHGNTTTTDHLIVTVYGLGVVFTERTEEGGF